MRLPADQRRLQLLEVARDRFAEQGFHATSMDEIAESAGVTKPVLYQHFPSKRALYVELLESTGAELLTTLADATGRAGTARDRVEMGFRAYFEFALGNRSAFRLLLSTAIRSDPEFARIVEEIIDATAETISLLIFIDGSPEQRLVLASALALLVSPVNGGQVQWADLSVLFAALTFAAMASYALIRIALRPVKELERIARKVSLGRVGERVPASLVADPDLAHLASTMNEMLDNLSASRKRMANLAAEVVYAQEKERAQVARDLHDSIGQTLAAASFQIAAAANQESLAEVRTQLAPARDLLRDSLEEIRNVSRSLHPRVADDLGLPAALRGLADLTRQRSLIDVRVENRLDGAPIPPALSSTLYRVAQEALRNVELHADAGTALVSLSTRPGLVELEVSDDGCGLDGALEKVQASPVLARMRQRLSLAGGDLHILSTPDCGIRVIARGKLEVEPGEQRVLGEGEAA